MPSSRRLAVFPIVWPAGLVLSFVVWQCFGEALASDFNHSHPVFGTVLERVVQHGLVDYAALKADPKDLDRYLDQLAAVPEHDFMAFSERQKIAFLINLYNAATLRLVIEHYPIKSINDIGNWLNGPFDQRVVRLMGRSFSLGDVQHAILRKNHAEPRAHFALVSASLGSPPLRPEPYAADRLDSQLDEQARGFLRDTSKNSVDGKTRTLYLSKIFKWYAKDFGRKRGSVLSFVLPYLTEAAAAEGNKGELKIVYTEYDWALNDAAAAATRKKAPEHAR